MDSDAWRPFDLVDVKRQVAPGRGAATTGRGFVTPSSDEDDVDDDRITIPTAISLPATAITLG